MTGVSITISQPGTDKPDSPSDGDGSHASSQEYADVKSQRGLDKKSAVSDINDDCPITIPDNDKLRLDVLSESIARCILAIPNPNGNVVAINGPWGAGKSSLVNLVIEDIKRLGYESSCPIVIRFNSWLYRTEDGVISGFFQELYSELKSRSDKGEIDLGSLLSIIEQMAGMTSIIRPGMDLFLPSAVGAIIENFGETVSSAIKESKDEPRSVEDLRKNLSKEIKDLGKHILIVIDDIDRLSPEEALAVFRLIKSVGRLENVIYLLAYDRDVAERMIEKVYPSEKKIYLEKIVQASFDLPELEKFSIISILEERFKRIFGESILENSEHIYNAIDSIVIPEIKTPRDIHRLANIISVTYPPVRNCVNIADFIVIETFRLFRPNLYHEIRSRKQLLTESSTSVSDVDIENLPHRIEEIFLSKEPRSDHGRLKRSLISIFPFLSGNYYHSEKDEKVYLNENRRIFSSISFDIYFRFSTSRDTISEAELVEFVQDISESYVVDMQVKAVFTKYLDAKSDDGQTRASLLLDKLAYSKGFIGDKDLKPFIVALYKESKNLDVPSDSKIVFGHREDNLYRIKKLSRNMLTSRFDLVRVSDIMLAACMAAPLKFRASLCSSMCRHYGLGKYSEFQEWVFLTIRDARFLQTLIQVELVEHVKNDTIINIDGLPFFLADWANIADKPDNVENEFRRILEKDTGNAIRASNEFIRLFPDKSKDDNPDKKQLAFVKNIIDVDHFVVHLHKILDNKSATDKDKNSARRLIQILGHIDTTLSRPQSK